MKKNSTLPAFTLMEMIIVMLITSILIGGVYMVYSGNERMFEQVITQDDHLIQQTMLYEVLKNDLLHSRDISYVNEELILEQSGFIEITYMFEEDKIVRVHPLQESVFDNMQYTFSLDEDTMAYYLTLTNTDDQTEVTFNRLKDITDKINTYIEAYDNSNFSE